MYKEIYHYKNFNSHFLTVRHQFDFNSEPDSILNALSNGCLKISLASIEREILRKEFET